MREFFQALMRREPAMTIQLVQAGLTLAISFGLTLTAEQIGAILAFSATLFGWIIRQHVTPVNGKNGKKPNGDQQTT